MLHQPVAHLFIDDVLRRICAHAAGIGPGIAISDALMILRSDQRRHALTIADDQERKFFTLQTLLHHNPRTGLTQHLAAEHFRRNCSCLFLTLADHHTFAGGQSIRLYHQRSVKVRQGLMDVVNRIANCVVRGRNAVAL